MSSAGSLKAGTVFAGDFRIVQPLAAGGMGSVYVAEQLSTGNRRALKLMHAELAWDARLRERFVQEARVGSRIDSDHVVEVVGAGIDGPTGMPWLAMELLDGVDLATLVKQQGPRPIAEVREAMGQLCHALAAAHRAGVVHRDLKPQNVFIARSRQQYLPFMVKVLDFGIAKMFESARVTSAATSVVGTPLWMAPEQADANARVSPASDVWALGLIAFYLLTGRWYWLQAGGDAASVMTLLREVLFEPIVPASVRAAQLGVPFALPVGFDAWFSRCVARDPRARFADAGQAMTGLDAALGGAGMGTSVSGMNASFASSAAGAGVMAPSTYGEPSQLSYPGQASATVLGVTPLSAVHPPRSTFSLAWILVAVFAVLGLGGVAAVGCWLLAMGLDSAGHPTVTSPPAAPVAVDGSYVIVSSSNPGGGGMYHGHATVTKVGDCYEMRWSLAGGQQHRGVGVLIDGTLAVAFSDGVDFAASGYRLQGGQLSGLLTKSNTPGSLERETLQGPAGLEGSFTITDSSLKQSGTVTIHRNGDTYDLIRSAAAGGHRGIGILQGGVLAVSWATRPQNGGVVLYRAGPGTLKGWWAPYTSSRWGTEDLQREAP